MDPHDKIEYESYIKKHGFRCPHCNSKNWIVDTPNGFPHCMDCNTTIYNGTWKNKK